MFIFLIEIEINIILVDLNYYKYCLINSLIKVK